MSSIEASRSQMTRQMIEPRGEIDESTSRNIPKIHNSPRYSKHDVSQVACDLLRAGNLTGSENPRLYIILRDIGRPELLDGLIEKGISDTWIPITSDNILSRLFSQTTRPQFLKTQLHVCEQPADFQLGHGGGHAHFAPGIRPPFVRRRVVGEGHMGKVDEVFSRTDSQVYARKSIRRTSYVVPHRDLVQAFRRELHALGRIRHKHCVQIVGSYTTSRNLVIIMSPLADSDLAKYLERAGDTFEPALLSSLRQWFGCLATAVHYLHSNKIRHRDIKPANILVHGERVLLVDCELAWDWKDGLSSTTMALSGFTPMYAAPEVIWGNKRNSSSDIWCLGCVFFEMATVLKGKSIFAQRAFFTEQADNSNFNNNERGITKWIQHLVGLSNVDNAPLLWASEMLQRDGKRRLKSAALLKLITSHARLQKSETDQYFGECCRPASMTSIARHMSCTICRSMGTGTFPVSAISCVQCRFNSGVSIHRNPELPHTTLPVSRMLSVFFPRFMFRHLTQCHLDYFAGSVVLNGRWSSQDVDVTVTCLPGRPLLLRLRSFAPSFNLVSLQQDADSSLVDARNAIPVAMFEPQAGQLAESFNQYLDGIVNNRLMDYSSFLLQYCRRDHSSRVLNVLFNWFQALKDEMPSHEVVLMKSAIKLIAIYKISEQAPFLEKIPQSFRDEFFSDRARPHRYSDERQSPLLVNLQVKVAFHMLQRTLLEQVLSGFNRLLPLPKSWTSCMFLSMCLAFLLERIEDASLKFLLVARVSNEHELSTLSDVEGYCDNVENIVFHRIYIELSSNIRKGIIGTTFVGSELVNQLVRLRLQLDRENAQKEEPEDRLFIPSRLVLSLFDLVEYI